MTDWNILDEQLKHFSKLAPDHTPVFSSNQLDQSKLASGLATDITQVLKCFNTEWPETIEELNDPVSINQRYDALVGYYHLMEIGDLKFPILSRSRTINQLYFDLVYFRDRVVYLLRDKISEQKDRFGDVHYLSEWLGIIGDNEFGKKLNALRNGFAHGKWEFFSNYKGIICYPGRQSPYKKYEFPKEELDRIHALIYAFIVVFFKIATKELAS
ncbi:MAG: hypothetical protein IEMM0002_0452 [bacterium]|nr:MAG: hypothetical protein IEMM0002_0452 [bacterium]